MKTRRTGMKTIMTAVRMLAVTLFFVGPLAGFAAAQDDSIHGPSGAGLVLYISLLRG